MSCAVVPPVARSARISPITGANLKPWPEQGEATMMFTAPGSRLEGVAVHPYFTIPLVGTVVSAESVAYALTQWMRYASMVAVGFPIAFCVAPADFGVVRRVDRSFD